MRESILACPIMPNLIHMNPGFRAGVHPQNKHMKIGLIDVDGYYKPKKCGDTVFPNLALAKIAAYHRSLGHTVLWYDPLFSPPTGTEGCMDIVYMSKVFNFTPEYPYPVHARQVIRGGTGYDIHSQLPPLIDDMQPDFSIYPGVPPDVSYGFLTRGCPNRCPWCIVPRKEGAVRPYWDVDRVANGRKKLILMDNNILAAGSYAARQLDKIIDRGYRVDFNQALDARLVTPDTATRLARIHWLNSVIRFGCDTHGQIKECERAMALINERGFTGSYLLYTMIGGKDGGDFHECFERVNHFRKLLLHHQATRQGRPVYTHAQPYRDPDNPRQHIPQWQKDMAVWCDRKAFFWATPFSEFQPRKGFKCKTYFETYKTEKPCTTNEES